MLIYIIIYVLHKHTYSHTLIKDHFSMHVFLIHVLPIPICLELLWDRLHSRYGLFAPETFVPTKPKVFTAQAFMALLCCPL